MKVNVIMSIQLSVFLVFSLYSGAKGMVGSAPNSSGSTSTNNDQSLVCNILAHSVSIAHKAAEIIREIVKSKNLEVVSKDDKEDFQTRADTESQRCIIAHLKNHFPNVKIIGEEKELDLNVPLEWKVNTLDPKTKVMRCPEGLRYVKEEQVTIWVDPLDGTREFTDGITEHVTTLIGIAVGDDVVAGLIYQPFWEENQGQDISEKKKGRAVWGVIGDKVHGLDIQLRNKDNVDTIFVTSKSHTSPALKDFMNSIECPIERPCKINHVGGSGYKVIHLLEGKADAYIYPSQGCKRWDTAGPEAVLRVAKGEFTDVYGEKYSYNNSYEKNAMNKGGIVATAPGFDHAKLIGQINIFMPKMKTNPKLERKP